MFLVGSRTCGSDFIFHKNKTSETIWKDSNKFDKIFIGIFDSTLRIYLCINTGIYFVLRDSALCLRGLLEVGATIDMRVDSGVGGICMYE